MQRTKPSVRAINELHRRYTFPGNVCLMDGGTQGIYLVQQIRKAEFIRGKEKAVGPYWMCSLFSPVLEFADQKSAETAAAAALEALLEDGEKESEAERNMAMVWRGELPESGTASSAGVAADEPAENSAMESLRENVLRIALDWPLFLTDKPEGATVRPLTQCVPHLSEASFSAREAFAIGREAQPDGEAAETDIAEAEALLAKEVFGEPLEVWLSRRGIADLLDWVKATPTVSGRFVAHVKDMRWFDKAHAGVSGQKGKSGELFSVWLKGNCEADSALSFAALEAMPESLFFARRAGDQLTQSLGGPGLNSRLIARLVELARLPDEMRALVTGTDNGLSDAYTDEGFGVGIVESARGTLAHAVKLRNGLIADYRIPPPTRLNFAGNGVAARCLSQLDIEDRDAREQLANLVVNAIDPCAAYEVRMD